MRSLGKGVLLSLLNILLATMICKNDFEITSAFNFVQAIKKLETQEWFEVKDVKSSLLVQFLDHLNNIKLDVVLAYHVAEIRMIYWFLFNVPYIA